MKIIKKNIFNKNSRSLISIIFVILFLTILIPAVNSNTIVKNNIEKSYINKMNFLENNVGGPDIETEGSLKWTRVEPGSTATGSFIVKNVGDPESKLDWKITEYPQWGEWTFTPKSGLDLTPEYGKLTIQVSVVAPNEEANFSGRIKVIDTNGNDYNFVLVSLSTPKLKTIKIDEKINFNYYSIWKILNFI